MINKDDVRYENEDNQIYENNNVLKRNKYLLNINPKNIFIFYLKLKKTTLVPTHYDIDKLSQSNLVRYYKVT